MEIRTASRVLVGVVETRLHSEQRQLEVAVVVMVPLDRIQEYQVVPEVVAVQVELAELVQLGKVTQVEVQLAEMLDLLAVVAVLARLEVAMAEVVVMDSHTQS